MPSLSSARHLPPVCILAGGLGTRLGDRVAERPKPLLEVAGEPFLLHQLRALATQGVEEVVLCVGYLGDLIEARIGPSQFGIRIRYSYDAPELDGTLGAVRRALHLLPERFLILYGDTYLRLDYVDATKSWLRSECLGMMTVLRNDGRWGKSNALYSSERVVAYDKSHPTAEMTWIDYGLEGLDVRALELGPETERHLPPLLGTLARTGQLFGYEVSERFYEIGTPAALRETELFLGSVSDDQRLSAVKR